jgi:DNA-binding response OmpR family regulator
MQTQSPRALLVGLEPDLASELERTLAQMGHAASRSDLDQVPALARRLDVIFCSDQASNVNSLVALLRSLRTPIRVIVASRKAEETAWLEALEAGADDYCSTPFETAQISWAMNHMPASASRSM